MRGWWGAAAVLAAIGPAHGADLSLQRVVLSSGGVGYFEYSATVDGDASLALDVPLDQIDDVLKSLVVYDDAGTAGEVTLPGREPLTQSFADLPFDRSALDSLPDLLNALQGAELRVNGAKPMSGRLLRVVEETEHGKDDIAVTRHRVSLLTASGIEQFILEDADSVVFLDPELQKQVAAALTRIAAYHADARRRLTIASHGKGMRTVRVGYVVGVPLWKASYRLSLPADDRAEQARLRGWAVLENFSGQAWHGVSLTLLSGNPVTFRQALFESYYVQRPTVPVEVAGHVLPTLDTGSLAGAVAQNAAKAAPAPMRQMQASRAAEAAPAAPAPPPPSGPAHIEAAEAAETATETAFTLPYKVDVAAGQSLVVPIIDHPLPAHRVDLYQPAADPRHPLAALALENDSGTGLPPGVLTLYQEGGAVYLGDARLAAFPPGEKRMLSYAVDAKIDIDRRTSEQQAIVKATIAEGVMRLTRRLRQTTTYRMLTAREGEQRLILEHPRAAGWTLTAPDPAQVEVTADAYRIPATLAAGKESSLVVTVERPLEETIRLFDVADDRLGALAASTELDPGIRKALGEVAQQRQGLARRTAEVEKLKQQRQQTVEDETRLRANLGAVGHDTALYKQTLEKLGETEATIASLSAAIAKGSADVDAAKEQLIAFVSGLNW
jgi:hypothetical protein